jgi:hypothetical protein
MSPAIAATSNLGSFWERPELADKLCVEIGDDATFAENRLRLESRTERHCERAEAAIDQAVAAKPAVVATQLPISNKKNTGGGASLKSGLIA